MAVLIFVRVIEDSKPDIAVINAGSVVLFDPRSQDGFNFLQDNCNAESWQWYHGMLAVHPSYVCDIIDMMQDAGLKVVRG